MRTGNGFLRESNSRLLFRVTDIRNRMTAVQTDVGTESAAVMNQAGGFKDASTRARGIRMTNPTRNQFFLIVRNIEFGIS